MINNIFLKILSRLGVSNKKFYIKDFISFSIGYFVAAFISFLTIFSVNKILTPYELGKYSYYKSIFDLVFGILSLNIYQSYLRFNLKGKNINLSKLVLKIVLISIFLSSIFVAIYTKCIYCALYSLLIIYNERLYYLRSMLDTKNLNWIRIIPPIITLILIGSIFYFNGKMDHKSVLICYGIGFSFVIFYFRKNNKIVIDKSSINIKEIFLFCFPVTGIILLNWTIELSAQVIIKYYYSYEVLANYSIAQRSLLVVKMFSGLFLMYYPMLYYKEISKLNNSFIKKSRMGILISMSIIIIIFFLFSSSVYKIMGADKYIDSVYIFNILLISEFFKITASLLGLFLTYKIKTYKNFMVLLMGALVNVTLLMLFLSRLGIGFAAVSSAITNIIITILYFQISYKKERKYLRNETN